MKSFLFRTISLAASMIMTMHATGANAAKFVLEVRGLASGFDENNFFGLGSSPINAAYTQRFTINESVNGVQFRNNSQSAGAGTYGGTSLVKSEFLINGKSVAFGGGAWTPEANVSKEKSGNGWRYSISVLDYQSQQLILGSRLDFTSDDPKFLSTSDYRTPFSVGVTEGDGYVRFSNDLSGQSLFSLSLDVRPLTATLNAVTAVPEPASWTMMIAGFGLVGGMMLRKPQGARSVSFY